MNLEINFDSIEAMKANHDFIPAFCKKVLALLDEFQKDYKKGIINSDAQTLSDTTHKISSTMRLLKLEEFYEFSCSYKKINLEDRDNTKKLLKQIIEYTEKLKNDLKAKISEFS